MRLLYYLSLLSFLAAMLLITACSLQPEGVSSSSGLKPSPSLSPTSSPKPSPHPTYAPSPSPSPSPSPLPSPSPSPLPPSVYVPKIPDEGEFKTSSLELAGPKSGKGFKVYHPTDLGRGGRKHPILSWGNPTGFDSSVFLTMMREIASHGFVIVASHDLNTGTGEEQLTGIDLLIAENRNQKSIFFGKLDESQIGAFGHSQGAGGTAYVAMDPRVKTTIPLHMACELPMFCPDPTPEMGPMLLIAGENDIFAPPKLLDRLFFQKMSTPGIMSVKEGATHYNPVSILGGDSTLNHYIISWFRFYLMNDQSRSVVFWGDKSELKNDRNWITQEKNW